MTFSLLACFMLPLAACAEDGKAPAPTGPDAAVPPAHGDANFATMGWFDRNDSIQRAIEADGSTAPALLVVQSEIDAMQGCPARTEAAGVVTYEGNGCTTAEGVTYAGELVARNVPRGDGTSTGGADASKPMEIDMNQFLRFGETFTGTMRQSTPLPAMGAHYTVSFDYSRVTPAWKAVIKVDGDCKASDSGGDCALAGTIDADQGSFVVDGHVKANYYGSSAGALDLRGADTLHVNFDALADGCVPYTVDDGAAGEFCFQPGATSTLAISDRGGVCDVAGTSLQRTYELGVTGPSADASVVFIDDTGARTTHAMSFISEDASTGEKRYSVSFTVPGTSCDAEPTVRYLVHATGGGYACAGAGPQGAQWLGAGCDT